MKEITELLAKLAPALSDDERTAAETAVGFLRYEPHDADEIDMLPHLVAVTPEGIKLPDLDGKPVGRVLVMAFDRGCIDVIGPTRQKLLAIGLVVAFICESWMSTDAKEVIEGSGDFMPPRVAPNRTESIMVQLITPGRHGRFLMFHNPIEGSGAQKHLAGWKLGHDSAGGGKATLFNAEPWMHRRGTVR